MLRIAITGGPCAGKTTVLDALKVRYADQIGFVPEAATVLLSGGFPVPGKDIDYSTEWQTAFQNAVLPLQRSLEAAYALKSGTLVCDRGTLDGAAYFPGGVQAFCDAYGLDLKVEYAAYAAVIHLESVATAAPDLYGTVNNATRYESLEQAQQLELATRSAWLDHPNHLFVSARYGLQHKLDAVFEQVETLLSQKEA